MQLLFLRSSNIQLVTSDFLRISAQPAIFVQMERIVFCCDAATPVSKHVWVSTRLVYTLYMHARTVL